MCGTKRGSRRQPLPERHTHRNQTSCTKLRANPEDRLFVNNEFTEFIMQRLDVAAKYPQAQKSRSGSFVKGSHVQH